MKLHNFKSAFVLAFALLLTPSVNAAEVSINDAWIAEAPPVSKVMAAYMTISNNSSEAIQVVDAESADFGNIEFHRTVHEDGMAKMQHQPSLVIPAKSELVLEPGGYHMMLFRPVRALRAGDTSTMVFKLQNGDELQVLTEVRKAIMEETHEHHHHHH